MQNVLVTGGAGYVGSHACKALKIAGFNPVTLDNLSTGWQEAVKFGPFEYGDLLYRHDLEYVFKKYSPVAVMHFAALSQVNESIQNPGLYWTNNVLGSLNLIEVAIENNCKKFIFSSTCATYGEQDNVVLNETSSQAPTNAYAGSKLAVEHMLRNYEKSHGMKYVIFRYFNVAGADPNCEVGEYHLPETHLIPLIFDAVCNPSDCLTLHGTDYATRDGTCIRDYVHVADLVDAHILGLSWLQNKNQSRVFNLGTGKGFTVREVMAEVSKVINRHVPHKIGPRRDGDCEKLVASSDRVESELGWNSSRSNLNQMINDAWNWYQHGGYYK